MKLVASNQRFMYLSMISKKAKNLAFIQASQIPYTTYVIWLVFLLIFVYYM